MSRLADEMRKTFASMHVSRNFRLFFVGQLISVTGTWVNWTAGAVLVLELTDSGVALGIEAALLFLPVLLFGVYAGSLADRFDKRRILVWSNAGYAVLAAAQFALVATGVVQIWMVFVIAFLTGLILAIEPPTRQSFSTRSACGPRSSWMPCRTSE
jgi:MFS family permease